MLPGNAILQLHEGKIGIVHIQRCVTNSSGKGKFTMNVGVSSKWVEYIMPIREIFTG
jgi:hypothetical protein